MKSVMQPHTNIMSSGQVTDDDVVAKRILILVCSSS